MAAIAASQVCILVPMKPGVRPGSLVEEHGEGGERGDGKSRPRFVESWVTATAKQRRATYKGSRPMSTDETGSSRQPLVYRLSGAQEPPVRNRGGRPRTRPHHIKIAPPTSAPQGPIPAPTRYLGLDVHAETITVAIADA